MANWLAICILLEQLEQAVDIAKHPQVSDLLTIERKECSPLPVNRFSSRLITKELAPVDARKAHTCKCLRTLDNEVKYVAAITRQGGVHKIDICSKPLMADLRLTERTTKSEAVTKQNRNLRLVVSVPDVAVKAFYN